MWIEQISLLFERELQKLKTEIELYQEEANLWKTSGDISNSAGNLCLHLIGNLKTYIGLGLGQFPYERNRQGEFTDKNIDRQELLKAIDETRDLVEQSLRGLGAEQLEGDFPVKIWSDARRTDFTLMHLYGHLTFHLGQITYHRRVVENHQNISP